MKDLASPLTGGMNAATTALHSNSTWGPQVADNTLQKHTLSSNESKEFDVTRL